MSKLTTVQEKAWLVFAKSRQSCLSRLSFNLILEVCTYMHSCLFPCIHNDSCTLYNLSVGPMRTATLSHSFGIGTVFCFHKTDSLLCLGGDPPSAEVFDLPMSTLELAAQPAMERVRAWPGVVLWRSVVYVFGGNLSPPLCEVEKYGVADKQWSAVGPMKQGRVAFMPVVYQDRILLISAGPGNTPVESFFPITETYQTLEIAIECQGYGALSFLHHNEVQILLYKGSFLQWNPANTHYSQRETTLPNEEIGISAIAPVWLNETLYWMQYLTGDLVQWEWKTGLIATPYRVKED